MKKDTIYIDIEDDITQLIEKVKSAENKIIALVLPKRFPVLQSSVNMKLLNKASQEDSKKIVLITQEKGLLPLAGDAGIYVADSLKSRPYIPETELDDADEEPILDESKPIGVLAGDPDEVVEDSEADTKQDDEDNAEETDGDKVEKAGFIASLKAGLKSKGAGKVPNFDQSRKKFVLLGVGLIALIFAWFYMFEVLPSAKIAITAKTTELPTNLSFSVDPELEESNLDEAKLAAISERKKVTLSEEFTPTGERDIGKKASGTMTIQNCDTNTSVEFPAGTSFTDESTGFSFESNSAVTVPGGNFSIVGGQANCDSPGEAEVPVTAVERGDQRNLSPRSYSVDGYPDTYSGFGGQMSGGTTEIVKVVTQEDVDAAVKKIKDRDNVEEIDDLISQFGEDTFVLSDSVKTKTGKPVSTPKVGDTGDKATVKLEFTHSAVGVKIADLEELLRDKHEDLLQNGEQVILDNGIEKAKAVAKETNGNYAVELSTDSHIGPAIDTIKLAEEIANKRYSEAESIIKSKPGVSEVVITPSPWYVYFIPDSDKIEITIEVKEAN